MLHAPCPLLLVPRAPSSLLLSLSSVICRLSSGFPHALRSFRCPLSSVICRPPSVIWFCCHLSSVVCHLCFLCPLTSDLRPLVLLHAFLAVVCRPPSVIWFCCHLSSVVCHLTSDLRPLVSPCSMLLKTVLTV